MSRRQLLGRLFSIFALTAFGFLLIPVASALPLKSGGGSAFGFHHHFVAVDCSWPTDGGNWTPDPNARTVTQDVATMSCDVWNLDPDGDGVAEPDGSCDSSQCPVNTGSATFSLTLTFAIPANASKQLSAISCDNDVRTYTAYCEQALFDEPDNGVTGSFTLVSYDNNNDDLEYALTQAGCTNLPSCSWALGSLPSTTKGKKTVLDTSKFGCSRAFPELQVTVGGGDVTLATNQLLFYKEEFTHGDGSCTKGTVAPVAHAARACSGEAADIDPFVTDCDRVGNGNNTDFHVAVQQNNQYLFNLSGFESVQANVQDASSCSNSGVVKFIVFGQDQFDVRSIVYSAVSPLLRVVGAENGLPPVKVNDPTDKDGDGRLDVEIFYSQCDLGQQITEQGYHAGNTVPLQIDGETSAATDGGSIAFTATTSVGVN